MASRQLHGTCQLPNLHLFAGTPPPIEQEPKTGEQVTVHSLMEAVEHLVCPLPGLPKGVRDPAFLPRVFGHLCGNGVTEDGEEKEGERRGTRVTTPCSGVLPGRWSQK